MNKNPTDYEDLTNLEIDTCAKIQLRTQTKELWKKEGGETEKDDKPECKTCGGKSPNQISLKRHR